VRAWLGSGHWFGQPVVSENVGFVLESALNGAEVGVSGGVFAGHLF
jgi:hypothetical protein